METLLDVDRIECRYADRPVVRELSLHLRPGGLACLLGPSGCGKTTVLRAIAGFMALSAGSVRMYGHTVARPDAEVPPEKRGVGMVFQDYALFPHLDVGANIAFGLPRPRGAVAKARVSEMLELVGLEGLAGRYPHELSGGQQQRVALARALAPNPSLVLLDEPFSSLDVELRGRLAFEVRDILKSQGIGALLVTHDQAEAFAFGEHVGVMRDGRLLQWDSAYNLYHEPADRFVADFIGQGRFVPGSLVTADTLDTPAGRIKGNRAYIWPEGTEVDVLLRPDDVVPDPLGPLTATVTNKAFKGAEILYTLRLPNGLELLSLFPSHEDHPTDSQVKVRISATHLVAFARFST